MITSVQTGMRVLVGSPLGKVIAPTLSRELINSVVTVAVDRDDVRRAVTGTFRYDVVIVDLIWNNPILEFSFDGFDVVDMLIRAERTAPVLFATQGHSMETDLLDEARLRPEISGIYEKATGVGALLDAINSAAIGGKYQRVADSSGVQPLYELFKGPRGTTAGRLAGAIAAGRASDSPSLARVAAVGVNTANKVTTSYLGPIMRQRGEHNPDLPLTLGSVYRWCGLHARYLMSWCRRNGHGDVLDPEGSGSD
jgi:hypothetical protein